MGQGWYSIGSYSEIGARRSVVLLNSSSMTLDNNNVFYTFWSIEEIVLKVLLWRNDKWEYECLYPELKIAQCIHVSNHPMIPS